jgi:hypothetical protein
LFGSLSPDAGNFSVALDNDTTTLSARSSFSQPDVLFFSATGLDPQSTHELTITNLEDKELSIVVGGFQVTSVQISSA